MWILCKLNWTRWMQLPGSDWTPTVALSPDCRWLKKKAEKEPQLGEFWLCVLTSWAQKISWHATVWEDFFCKTPKHKIEREKCGQTRNNRSIPVCSTTNGIEVSIIILKKDEALFLSAPNDGENWWKVLALGNNRLCGMKHTTHKHTYLYF